MQTITSLKRQKRNKDRVSVYLDGEFAFGLDEMDAAHLRTGQQLSEDEIAELRYKDRISKAIHKSMDYLSYRPRSKDEIRRKLAKKDYLDDVIEIAIERLSHLGYLDDEAFARSWIESRHNTRKPRGAHALRYELRRKGVADSIINRLIDELVDDKSAAYDAAQTRIRRMRGSTRYEFKQKVGAFLQRRGFSYHAANTALETIISELQESEPDYFQEPDESEWY